MKPSVTLIYLSRSKICVANFIPLQMIFVWVITNYLVPKWDFRLKQGYQWINANPLIFFCLSRITTYYLSKGRQFIVQDLLAS